MTGLISFTQMTIKVKVNIISEFNIFFLITAMCLGEIEVNPSADLEQVRQIINKLQEEPPKTTESGEIIPKLTPDWCFVDCKLNKVK